VEAAFATAVLANGSTTRITSLVPGLSADEGGPTAELDAGAAAVVFALDPAADDCAPVDDSLRLLALGWAAAVAGGDAGSEDADLFRMATTR
jgi:hypothetical protein